MAHLLTLQDLPEELIGLIVRQISEHTDLKRLCETSRLFYRIVTPLLYKSIKLFLEELDLQQHLRPLERMVSKAEAIPLTNLKHTTGICMKAPFHYELRNRCPHHNIEGLDYGLFLDAGKLREPDSFHAISDLNDSWLDQIEVDQLRSFSWELGTCVPRAMIDRGSKLLKRQQRIEKISLITDQSCKFRVNDQFSELLTRLKELKHLSWKGLGRHSDFITLRRCILRNGRHLKSLTLDLVDWHSAMYSYNDGLDLEEDEELLPDNFFARDILSIKDGQQLDLLPSLESLSLSAISFGPVAREMVYAMHMNQVRVLKLWNCEYSFDLLDTMIQLDAMPNLKSFELTLGFEHPPDPFRPNLPPDQTIYRFLMKVRDLEDLFLSLADPIDWDAIMYGILSHASTLKRLVTHGRFDGDLPHKKCDERKDLEPNVFSQSQHLLHYADLDCIGVSLTTSTFPSDEDSIWSDILKTKPQCSVLHIRTGAPDHWGSPFDINLTQTEISDSGSEESTLGASSNSGGIFANTCISPPAQNEGGQHPEKFGFSRRVHAEVLRFAQRAFGPDGLPQLQVIAFGDFSHEGRFADKSILLCRDMEGNESDIPFVRRVKDTDGHINSLVLKNWDMLSACPTVPLLSSFHLFTVRRWVEENHDLELYQAD